MFHLLIGIPNKLEMCLHFKIEKKHVDSKSIN